MSALMQDDARNSIEVIHGIQRMRNQLGRYAFREAPKRQPKLAIEGLEISIRADLLVDGSNRKGDDLICAAVLRMTQSGDTSESAISKRREMGLSTLSLLPALTLSKTLQAIAFRRMRFVWRLMCSTERCSPRQPQANDA